MISISLSAVNASHMRPIHSKGMVIPAHLGAERVPAEVDAVTM